MVSCAYVGSPSAPNFQGFDTLVEELAAFAYTIRRGDRENLRNMLKRAREIKEAIDKDC